MSNYNVFTNNMEIILNLYTNINNPELPDSRSGPANDVRVTYLVNIVTKESATPRNVATGLQLNVGIAGSWDINRTRVGDWYTATMP